MGYARVVSGGPDGRYVIEMDYGESTRVAVVAALSALVARLQTDLGTVQASLAEAEEKEAAKLAQVQSAQAAYILEAQALPPGSPLPDSNPWQFLQAELLQMQAAHAPLRLMEAGLKFDIAARSKELGRWNVLSLIEQRPAWCTTLTENLAPGQYPATVEIPGESNLILIAPNGRGWTPWDGYLRARELMSPAQAFFNAAILPGWQKDKPTYRWGTITAINYGANTADVALAAATSSAQSLNVNPSSSLSAVPVVYMTCNAQAFEVGDRVVVQFVGQDWGDPRVIGFVDNPKSCGWTCIGDDGLIAFANSDQDKFDRIFAGLVAGTLTVEHWLNNKPTWESVYATECQPNQPENCPAPTITIQGESVTILKQAWQLDNWQNAFAPTMTLQVKIFRNVAALLLQNTVHIASSTPAAQDAVYPPPILEIRIKDGAELLFNAACRLSPAEAKVEGGVALRVGYAAVTVLDYKLQGA